MMLLGLGDPDPTDYPGVLKAFWAQMSLISAGDIATMAAGDPATFQANYVNKLAQAQAAMSAMVAAGALSSMARMTFADPANPIFLQALSMEAMGGTDAICAIIAGQSGILKDLSLFSGISLPTGSIETRPPRQIMLEGIYSFSNGGLFGAPDPSGLATWISSEGDISAVVATLLADNNGDVQLALLQLLRSVALPLSWALPLIGSSAGTGAQIAQGPLAVLAARAGTQAWSQDSTAQSAYVAGITGGVAKLQGLLGPIALQMANPAAAAALAAHMASFTAGNGSQVLVTAPPPKDWYRNGYTWLAIGLGLLGGGFVAEKLAKR